MNGTVTPVPRCHAHRCKLKPARFHSPSVGRCPVFGQPTTSRKAPRRRLATLSRAYVITVFSFSALCIYVETRIGQFFADASSLLPEKQDASGPYVTGVLCASPAARSSDEVSSQRAASSFGERAKHVNAELHSISEWALDNGKAEEQPAKQQVLSRSRDAAVDMPSSVLERVWTTYLFVLEHELVAALKKLNLGKRKIVSNTVGREQLRAPHQLGNEEGGPFESAVAPYLSFTETFPQEPEGMPGAVAGGTVAGVVPTEVESHLLDSGKSYVSEFLAPSGTTVKEKFPGATDYGYLSLHTNRLLVGTVKKRVQQILKDIKALTNLQRLVMGLTRRLDLTFQAEQELKKRIGCLGSPEAETEKDLAHRGEGQPSESSCAQFEQPHTEEERRALRLAFEKQLRDVRWAGEEAGQLLLSVLSTHEVDIPLVRQISPSYARTSPVATVPSAEQEQVVSRVAPQADEQAGFTDSGIEAFQPRPQSTPHRKVGSAGLTARALASVPPLRGHTLFTKDVQPRPSYAAVPSTRSPVRSSSPSPYYAPRVPYQCFKRTEGYPSAGVLMCECTQPPETVQEATTLEPLLCTRVRRASYPRSHLPAVEQPLECHASVVESSHAHPPAQPPPRPAVELAAVAPWHLHPVTEPTMHCSCFKTRAQYDCRRVPTRLYTQPPPLMEPVRVVPEVVEHRAVEPVVTQLECELPHRPEVHYVPHAPVPESVWVPTECIQSSVPVPGSFAPKQEAELYTAGYFTPASRERVVIPAECLLRSSQVEKVPCECIPQPAVSESIAYVRAPTDYTPYVECLCMNEHQPSPQHFAPVYSYEVAE